MVKRNPLGKGLSALLPSSEQSGERAYFICPLEAIEPNPGQPRKQLNDQDLAQLAESIREKGVLLPLVVRRVSPERYQLIAGERRWRAAALAGLKEIPVLIKDVSPQNQLELALIENIQRRDLNPMEEAEAYLRLVKEYGLTQEEVAKRVGKERSTVANALRINQLPDFVKDDLIAGRISMGHGRVLLSLDNEQQLRELRDEIIGQDLSVRQAEELGRRRKNRKKGVAAGGNSRKTSNAISESYCHNLTTELNRYLGTKVRIVQKGARGKLEIDYYSPDELQRVSDLIIATK